MRVAPPAASARFLSAILHCVSPAAFAHGETPFRMTVGFWRAVARGAAVLAVAGLSSTLAFGVGAGVSAEQKQKEMEEEVTRAANAPKADLTKLQCGNLVYAGTKSSICFADKFLSDVAAKTNLNVGKNFIPVRLDADHVFEIRDEDFIVSSDYPMIQNATGRVQETQLLKRN